MGNYDYLKFIWYAKFLLIVINIDFNFINPPFNHVVSTQNFNTIIKTRDYSLTQKHVQNVDFEINDWPYELVFLYMYLRFEFSVCYSFEWARKKRKYIKTLIYGLIYWNWMIQNKNDYEFDTSNCLNLNVLIRNFYLDLVWSGPCWWKPNISIPIWCSLFIVCVWVSDLYWLCTESSYITPTRIKI